MQFMSFLFKHLHEKIEFKLINVLMYQTSLSFKTEVALTFDISMNDLNLDNDV